VAGRILRDQFMNAGDQRLTFAFNLPVNLRRFASQHWAATSRGRPTS
jgi:hypothetical protein